MSKQLPEKSRIKLAWIADQLRHGFTGDFRLVCVDGGVRNVYRSDSPSIEGGNGKILGHLPEKSRSVLAWLADELRNGFSGEFYLECLEGLIQDVQRKDSPSDKQIAEEMLTRQEERAS